MKGKPRPLLFLLVLFSSGIVCQNLFRFPFAALLSAAAACLLISLCVRRLAALSTGFLVVTLIFASGAYTDNRLKFARDHFYYSLSFIDTKQAGLEGRVVTDTVERSSYYGKKTTFEFAVEKIRKYDTWKLASGKLLVQLYGDRDVAYGDILRLTGKLSYPHNFSENKNFSYRRYLNRKGIYRILHVKKSSPVEVLGRGQGFFFADYCFQLRRRMKRTLHRYLDRTEAGIMQAVLIGDRSFVPERIRELFVHTGTAHVLAISGLHVGIVAAFFILMIRLLPISCRLQYLIVIFLIAGYCLLTGARPSILRASIMCTIFLAGLCIERESDAVNSLSLSALVILLINPNSLYDIGFQLSFMSVICILGFFPWLSLTISRCLKRCRLDALVFLSRPLAVSLAAWTGVAGLIAYYFGVITPVAVMANLIVIPLICAVVVLGLGLIIVGATFSVLADPFAMTLRLALNLLVGAVYLIEKVPASYIFIKDVSLWQVLTYYGLGAVCSASWAFAQKLRAGIDKTC